MPKLIEYFNFRHGFQEHPAREAAEVADKDGGESSVETESLNDTGGLKRKLRNFKITTTA